MNSLDAIGFTIMFGVFGLLFLFELAVYVGRAIALLRMAKKTGVKHGWIGFIPYGDMWLLGRISDVGSTRRYTAPLLLGLSIGETLLGSCLLFSGLLASFSYFGGSLRMIASQNALWLGVDLLVYAVSITKLVLVFISYFRICKNFSWISYGGWFAGLLVCELAAPIGVPILLLILSGKTPRYRIADEQTVYNA